MAFGHQSAYKNSLAGGERFHAIFLCNLSQYFYCCRVSRLFTGFQLASGKYHLKFASAKIRAGCWDALKQTSSQISGDDAEDEFPVVLACQRQPATWKTQKPSGARWQ
jgi:hypothetical protein